MKPSKSHIKSLRRGIALVITLLMLSVITFLAVAFLVMTNRDTSAKVATLDVSTAQGMSEAGLARAQAEIVARMTAQTDILAFDYMVSSNYITPSGYLSEGTRNKAVVDTNDVNYDYYNGGGAFRLSASSANDWAQNIANLFFDPRPPVFVPTNTDPTKPSSDFRYYVDLNRNGSFEGSSFRAASAQELKAGSLPVVPNTSGQQGEPEWIGVLADPTHPHSRDNPFVGRYAYMVLPLGKTLDFNFIHNESQGLLNSSPSGFDEFVRDQGVGPWEMNLAAYLRDLNTNIYGEQPYINPSRYYDYNLPNGPTAKTSLGYCFDDARVITTNRLAGYSQSQTLAGMFGNTVNLQFLNDGIDEYGVRPLTSLNGPFDFVGGASGDDPDKFILASGQWPGSYPSNMLYDVQDLFNPTMTSVNFTNRLLSAGTGLGFVNLWANYPANTRRIEYDRYTLQRMLATIGTGADAVPPDYSTYVYTNEVTNFTGLPQTMLRAKMNLNYDNSAQMASGPYAPMINTPTPWTDPLKFFTNAADLLLRTQDFPITNSLRQELEIHHFGYNMSPYYPIYSRTNSSYRYTAQLHRMLQLAANLYDEGHNQNVFVAGTAGGTNVYSRFPSVFRPLIAASNQAAYIVGYELITSTNAISQFNRPWVYVTNLPSVSTNVNVYGIPWVVGAVKGIPEFNQYCLDTCFGLTRKINIVRASPQAGSKITSTNQIYLMSISNRFGMDAWNPYRTPFERRVDISASVHMEVTLTNNSTNYPWGTNIFISTNIAYVTNSVGSPWQAWGGSTHDRSIATPLLANSNFFTSLDQTQARLYSDLRGSGGPGNSARGFWDSKAPNVPYFDTNTYTVHNWMIYITNYVTYLLLDDQTKNVLDFVNVGPFGSSLNVTQLVMGLKTTAGLNPAASLNALVWNQAGANDSPNSPVSAGVLNQIQINMGGPNSALAGVDANAAAKFRAFMTLQDAGSNSWINCTYEPSVLMEVENSWAANDPLVHYTPEDLTSPTTTTNIYTFDPSTIPGALQDTLGQVPKRYDPWPTPQGTFGKTLNDNFGLKDPGITEAQLWNFPTNLYPNVGWIGRVHRGTPWQTIYLKADKPDNGGDSNISLWRDKWVGDLSPGLDPPGASYPTNDWFLLDLFTAAPNDNALRGTLSVNQTNLAPWHALLDGVIVLTNQPNGIAGIPIGPAETIDTNANAVSYIMDSAEGINNWRTNFPGKLFHHVGDILHSPTLTIASPYISTAVNAAPVTDELLERIPQQIGGLLKVGEPQFVIYAWGQSLRPSALYNPVGGSTALFKLATNYSITGEYLTRTVCHLDLTKSDRFGSNAVLQVDSFNILPAAQ